MGIKGLTALLSENAPKSMKDHDIKTLFGRKVAIDASMSIYQFLVAVRQKDGTMLMNENGDVTSHLMGFFFRTLRMVDQGIKPMYVFDGKPPDLKGGVLAKRFAARNAAAEAESEAKEVGTTEDIDKLARRQVRPTRQMNEECRRLLELMGIPLLIAPGEAEAQCAELARSGKVYAAGSEDMDTLTFNAPLMLRHLTYSEAKKAPISEINLKVALEELGMSMEQFVELCILLGCDYLEPAKGVGPKTALKLMREHGSLGSVVQFIRGKMAEKQEEVEKFEQEVLELEEQVPGEESESEGEDDLHVDSEEEGLDLDGFESEDGYERGVKADLAGNEEELDVPAQTTIGKAKGKGKKRKVVLDSDDSDQEDEKPTEPTKEKEGSPNWESSPEPTSPKKTTSTPKAAAKKTPASSKTSSTPTQTQAKSKSKKPTATTSTQGKKKPPAKGGMQLPEYWPWEEAKKIFMTPDVTPGAELELDWKKPDVEGLVQFLCREKGFNEDRVRSGCARLMKMVGAKQQGRLDGFFKPMGTVSGGGKAKVKEEPKGKGGKRKADEKEKAGPKKKGKK